MIEITLQVTALQLMGIAHVMGGENSSIQSVVFANTSGALSDETAEVFTKAVAGPDAEAANNGDALGYEAEPVNNVPQPELAERLAPATAAGSMFAESDAAAAAPSVAETAPSVNTVELGKGLNGQMIPWDARIHGAAKKQNAGNDWRLKQGVDREVLVPKVEAELLQAMGAAPAATVEQITQAEVNAGNLQAAAVVPPPPTTPATTVIGKAAPVTDVPPPPAGNSPTTFAELLPVVSAAKAAGTLTDAQIDAACAELGLAQFGLIATVPAKIPEMVKLLGV